MSERCRVRVLRFDPTVTKKPAFEEFEVPRSTDSSVLDALLHVVDNVDGSLAVNHSCGKQRCGSCAMMIDGKISLACYTPLKDGQTILPLPGFRVIRDLVVDWAPYEDRMNRLVPAQPAASAPARLHPTERDDELADVAMTCIKCFSCVGACPTVDLKRQSGFAGPAISVMLASYLNDSKREESLLGSVLDANLEFCTRCYACNAVCPAEIDIVASINRLQETSSDLSRAGRDLLEMVQGYF